MVGGFEGIPFLMKTSVEAMRLTRQFLPATHNRTCCIPIFLVELKEILLFTETVGL